MPMTLADAFASILFSARPQPTAAEIDEREAAALAEIERRSPSPKRTTKRTNNNEE